MRSQSEIEGLEQEYSVHSSQRDKQLTQYIDLCEISKKQLRDKDD